MTDLGPNTRALLASVRNASDDEDAEMSASRDRVRGSLGRKLGVAAVGIGVATTASTAGAGATASVGMGLLGKVIIGVAALAISAGGVAIARKPAPAHAPPPPSIIAPRAIELPNVSTTTAAPTAPTAPAVEPRASASGLPVVTPTPPTPAPANPSLTLGAPVVPVAKPAPSITEELAALRKANDAIAAGNAGAAIAILDASPATTLTEERTGLRLLARCMLGHGDAPGAAKSFLAAHPSSPLASRLRVACAGF